MKYLPVFVLFAAALPSQATWSLQLPATRPPARESHNLVYDPASQRTFLFFGLSNGLPTTTPYWMWDGSTWTAATATYSSFLWTWGKGGMCEDGNGGMLMFGGYRPGFGIGGGMPLVLDETWQVTGTAAGTLQFTALSPVVKPPARQGTVLVHTNQGVLLFGGTNVNGTLFFNDTWLWNGTTWSQVITPQAPPARAYHAMAFDANRNVVVLFGGATGSTATIGDTWEFDGTTWQQRSPAHAPAARLGAACVHSQPTGQTLLFGGGNSSVGYGDLWTWDGTDWHGVAPNGAAPSARQGAAFAFDPAQQQAFLFGGRAMATYDDSYYLDVVPAPSTYTPFGTGCIGPTGLVPALAAVANEVPAVGTTSHLRVTNLGGGLTLPVFVLGTSNAFEASPPSHPLPFDLGFLGWPGCQQLVSHEVFDAVPTLTGDATIPFTVPFEASLIGFTFHAQVLVLFAPSGASVSNALTGVVGF